MYIDTFENTFLKNKKIIYVKKLNTVESMPKWLLIFEDKTLKNTRYAQENTSMQNMQRVSSLRNLHKH